MLFFLPAKIKLALNITFSQIPNILYEFEKITLVQKSKGFSPGIKKKYKILPVLFIPLIHRIIKRGENLTIIMISKAYE
jgi:energy-coupling factor transporter transmembrane protein EcfT